MLTPIVTWLLAIRLGANVSALAVDVAIFTLAFTAPEGAGASAVAVLTDSVT